MVKLCVQAGRGVHLEIAESGTFQELEARLRSYRPHIVQLSGHAGTMRRTTPDISVLRTSAGGRISGRLVRSRRAGAGQRSAGYPSAHAGLHRGRLFQMSGVRHARSGSAFER